MVSFATIRFPLIFGAFLATGTIVFLNRGKVIGNLEDERRVLHAENLESRRIIQDKIDSMQT